MPNQTLVQLLYGPLLTLIPAAEMGGPSQVLAQNPVTEPLCLEFLGQC